MAKTPRLAEGTPPSHEIHENVALMPTMSSQNMTHNPEKTPRWNVKPWEIKLFIVLMVTAATIGGALAIILKPELSWLPW